MMVFDLLCIAVICVVVIDKTDFIDNIKTLISIILPQRIATLWNMSGRCLKPLDCSLCSTFWACFIYLLYMGAFNLPLMAFVLLLSYLTTVIGYLIDLIKDILTDFIIIIRKKLDI